MPHERTHHGDTFVDEYEWLRDPESPETLAYLEAENAYTEARTAHLDSLREQIFAEIKAHTLETDLSVPYRMRRLVVLRPHPRGQAVRRQLPLPRGRPRRLDPAGHSRPTAAIPGEQVLLDADELAEGHEFFSLGGVSVSPDGRLLAFGTDMVGDERYLLRVKDLRHRRDAARRDRRTPSAARTWDRSGSTSSTHRRRGLAPRQGLAAPAGHHRADDVLVHHEADERF